MFRLTAAIALFTCIAHALPEPRDFREGAMKNPQLRKTDGELFCWNAQIAISSILTGYEATKDPRWLDEAVTYFDFLQSKLTKDPDGYEGWIGKSIWEATGRADHANYLSDAVVGDATLLDDFLRFSEIVLADPALNTKYGDRAGAHIKLAQRVGWEKWNKRGTYYRCAAGYGSYHIQDQFIDAGTGKWVTSPTTRHSENLNKHSAMGIVCLRLYRLTGEEPYRVRVVEIFSRLKNLFRHVPEDDRVTWNFWMPHGPHDIIGTQLASWVAVHPKNAGYQATEVARMVECYDSGLVFDRADIQRLVNANHFMISTGKWRSSDGSTDAGTLWGSLARFDEKIRKQLGEKLASGKGHSGEISRAHFENVTLKETSETPLHLKDPSKAAIYDFKPRPGQKLTANVVIPNLIETVNDDETALVTQTRGNGPLTIDLIDKSTGENLGRIYEESRSNDGLILPKWNGTNPNTKARTPGDYLIRWTFAGEVRDEFIRVIPGTKKAKQAATAFVGGVLNGTQMPEKAITKGETLTYDFSGKLDNRWHLKGAAEAISSLPGGRPGTGIRLDKNATATLAFGREENLPVRISMMVYDGGEKNGTASINGPCWGVCGTDGEFRGPSLMWRKFLGTDGRYSWSNTADGGWFKPQNTSLVRKTGWHEWTFDLTDPAAPKLILDGSATKFPNNGLPNGAVAINLRGDSKNTPLFVTGVKVEFP